jgi:hypothetical protein
MTSPRTASFTFTSQPRTASFAPILSKRDRTTNIAPWHGTRSVLIEHYASRHKPARTNINEKIINYASSSSSFRGGTVSNAFCSVRDPNDPDPLATRSIIVGIDSYPYITVAHRDIVYNIRRIDEMVNTGGGEATYVEEGLVDIVDGFYSFFAQFPR